MISKLGSKRRAIRAGTAARTVWHWPSITRPYYAVGGVLAMLDVGAQRGVLPDAFAIAAACCTKVESLLGDPAERIE